MFISFYSCGGVVFVVTGYVIKMKYDRHKENMTVYTLSLLALLKRYDFHITESGPPKKSIAFSTFQAKGKPFFIHTDVFQDRELLSRILGAYSVFEANCSDNNTEK